MRREGSRFPTPGLRAAPRPLLLASLLPVLLAGPIGCITERVRTHTPRTATEQLLLAESAERAVEALALPGVQGRRVAIELTALGRGAEFHNDLPYLRTALEARLREEDAVIVAEEEAERILAVRASALGTTGRERAFGLPPVNLGVAATPEVSFYSATVQSGFTKLRAAQRNADGEVLGETETTFERTRFREWRILIFSFGSSREIYPKGQGPG